MKQKTIIIAHNYTENSFSAMSVNLAHNIANQGYRVVFISHRPFFKTSFEIIKGKGKVIVISWPTKNRPTTFKDFFWFITVYLKYKPTSIIGHFVGSNITILASKIVSFGKVKTLEYYHTLTNQILLDSKNSLFKQNLLFFRKKLFYFLFCDVIICPSNLAKIDLAKTFGIKKGLTILNPMLDRFIEKNEISNKNIIVSFLGRLDSSKGVLELIEAFISYKGSNIDSKIILNIAGSGTLNKEVTAFANQQDSINFVGGLTYDKIDNYLNSSHFTIIPSKFDALNMVGVESMMNQTPLLISNTTGLSEYLVDGKECYKFDSKIDSIISLFSKVDNNIDKIEQMSLNARTTFTDKFSMDKYCDVISKLI